MTLEEIQNLWSKDANVDRTELGEEAIRIPQIHSKYFKIFSTERLKLKKQESADLRLKKYSWSSDDNSLPEGWKKRPSTNNSSSETLISEYRFLCIFMSVIRHF